MTTAVANPIYVNGLFVTISVTICFNGLFEMVKNPLFYTKNALRKKGAVEWTILDLNQ